MSLRQIKTILLTLSLALAAVAGYATYRTWWAGQPVESAKDTAPSPGETEPSGVKIIVGDQAQKNLSLAAKPVQAETFWKTITIPGMLVDRPGVSDHQVASPATGVIDRIWHVSGETVRPGDVLFTLRLMSEPIHAAQAALYKATQDIHLAQAKRKRLASAGAGIPQARLIEVENDIKRLEVVADANRNELRNRGLSPGAIEAIAEGEFIREIPVVVPAYSTIQRNPAGLATETSSQADASAAYSEGLEVQELEVEVGQEVRAGQTLCELANHRALAVEGRAFREEIPLLNRNIEAAWPVEVDFQEAAASDWPPIEQNFLITRITNTIDPVTRTFSFLVPLTNQCKALERDGQQQFLWRFRPGQKVRILVRVEQLDNVFVLPADALVREGANAFVFTQNVNTFERKPVHVVHEDRDRVVVANDGSLPTFRKRQATWTIPAIVQNAAPQLNRMAKSGSTATPKGFHVHADGSLHKNEDEGK